MSAAAFSTGQRFCFPGDDVIYIFGYVKFDCNKSIIVYEADGIVKEREAHLEDLIHV
jgi:hypothetical protein